MSPPSFFCFITIAAVTMRSCSGVHSNEKLDTVIALMSKMSNTMKILAHSVEETEGKVSNMEDTVRKLAKKEEALETQMKIQGGTEKELEEIRSREESMDKLIREVSSQMSKILSFPCMKNHLRQLFKRCLA